MILWTVLGGVAAAAWLTIALLPWQPHRTRERLSAETATADLSEITVLIPARDEAEHIGGTLALLAEQGNGLHVIVVDDRSTDATATIVRSIQSGADDDNTRCRVELVSGEPLPPGWGGKLWALQQGVSHVDRRYCLLLDADIRLKPRFIPALLSNAKHDNAALVSIMATLRCRTFWERLLVPPFVFFFKLLYPFALVARPQSRVAAAAGGCILVESAVLHDVGAFHDWANALIDDCTLARHIKRNMRHGGRPMRLLMSTDVSSSRGYSDLRDFWTMVTRTAYTQLNYSGLLLLLTTAVMMVVFVGPFAALIFSNSVAGLGVGVLAIAFMTADFVPVARFYSLPVIYYLTLPLAAILFLAMTWHSAIKYYAGTRATWKSRHYDS